MKQTNLLYMLSVLIATIFLCSCNTPSALYSEGVEEMQAGNYHTAIDIFTKVLSSNSKHVGALSSRGWAFYYLSDYNDAIGDFTRSLEVKESRSILDARGLAYLKLGLFELAIDDFNRSLDITQNPYTLDHRGLTFYYQEKYNLALVDLGAAIHIDPEEPIFYLHRADIYIAIGQFDKAISDLQMVIRLTNDNELLEETQSRFERIYDEG